MGFDERRYNPHKATDLLGDVNAFSGLGSTVLGLLAENHAKTDDAVDLPFGPLLALFAGAAFPETELLDGLPPDSQQMLAVDYNPNLRSEDKRIRYVNENVAAVLPTLDAASFGVVSLFGSDSSFEQGDLPFFWNHISRVLKPRGFVVFYPLYFDAEAPENFETVTDGYLFIAQKIR